MKLNEMYLLLCQHFVKCNFFFFNLTCKNRAAHCIRKLVNFGHIQYTLPLGPTNSLPDLK
jgi:hypothetical protein